MFQLKISILVLLVCATIAGCSKTGNTTEALNSHRLIHPRAFNLAMCYESDLEYPVATAINLTAALKNKNQFPFDEVKIEGEWIIWEDSEDGTDYRYKIISKKDKIFKVLYSERGKRASMSISRYITFTIEKQSIIEDGVSVPIENLLIKEMSFAQ